MLELTHDQLHVVRALLQAHLPGRPVRAFGSRAEGRAQSHSDLDLVILDDAPIPALVLAELRADFEESDLPFRVDLVRWADLPPTLQQHIRTHAIPITD